MTDYERETVIYEFQEIRKSLERFILQCRIDSIGRDCVDMMEKM